MATRDPKYLRLADRIAVHGCRHDLNSGFGISGFDVVPFPEDPAAIKFARTMIRKGIFEEAGKAEYEEVVESNPDADEVQRVVMLRPGQQTIPEHILRQNIEKAGAKVAKRAQARALAAEELDDDDDDDDDFRAGDAQRPTAKERRKAIRASEGKGKKKSKSKVAEEDDTGDEDEETGDEGEQPQS